MAETVPCSLFPVPCPHGQLFQQTLFTLNFDFSFLPVDKVPPLFQ